MPIRESGRKAPMSRAQRRASDAVEARARNQLVREMTRDEVILLADQQWWRAFPPREAARLQLCQEKKAMPVELTLRGLAEILERQVYLHELGTAGTCKLWGEMLGREVLPVELEAAELLLLEHQRRAGW